MLPLEQMGEEDHEVASDCLFLAASHVGDLVDQIGQIETLERASLQQRDLLLDPTIEIAVVEALVGGCLRARHARWSRSSGWNV
jgi:hypothetical protein